MYVPAREGVIKHRISRLVAVPSWKVECAYYLATIYSFAAPLGLEVPALAGAMLLAIAATCIWQLRASLKPSMDRLLCCLHVRSLFCCVQIVVHDESIMGPNLRGFIIWIFGLIIVPALCLRRGFYLRYPFFFFVVGAVTLPFLEFDPEKAGWLMLIRGANLSSRGSAEWFGFCAVFFAILVTSRGERFVQIGAWLMAVGCLLVMTFTIERAP